MPDDLLLRALLKALVLPPVGPLLLAGVGLTISLRFPRVGRTLAATGIVVLLALSMPAVAYLLLRLVETSPHFDPASARTAHALVILGGGTRRDAIEYGGDTLGRLTLERVRYGARVARASGLPVLVSGGSVLGGETEAKLMKESLESEFGIPVRWVEGNSRTTHENAVYSAAVLRADGIERVVLVAHGFDLPRAAAEFSGQGIEVVPAPTLITASAPGGPLEFIPTVAGLQSSYYALYEILANGVLWVKSAR